MFCLVFTSLLIQEQQHRRLVCLIFISPDLKLIIWYLLHEATWWRGSPENVNSRSLRPLFALLQIHTSTAHVVHRSACCTTDLHLRLMTQKPASVTALCIPFGVGEEKGYFEISHTEGCSRVSPSQRQKKKKNRKTSMAGTDTLDIKGHTLEIVPDTTVVITNSTVRK